MAQVDLGVAGLLEGAEHEVAQDALLGLSLDAGGEFLIHAGGDGDVFGDLVGAGIAAGALGVAAISASLDALDGESAEAEGVAEGGGELLKLDHAAGVGLLVDAIEGGDAEVLKPGGDALVGGEHELLDEAVGPGALGLGDAAHLALLVELDDRLGEIEVDGAALLAALVHEAGQLAHEFKAGGEGGVAGAGFLVALENGVDVGVGHAGGGADDALDDLEGLDAAGGVELDEATEDQAVFRGAEAANAGGELVGEHGNGAIGEVDAGSAKASLEVEVGRRAHVFRDVGDVDLELVAGAVGVFTDQDGVVEIAGGFAVDGDDGQGAEIAARGDFGLIQQSNGGI